jgi:hypothetical protein
MLYMRPTSSFIRWLSTFLVAHAGLFSAFVVTYPGFEVSPTLLSLSIPLLGLSVAIVWFLVMRGAVYFQQRWREQVIKLDAELDRFKCYVEIESLAKKRPYLSPSYVTQFLPVIFGVAWFTILVALLSKIR